MDKNHSEVIEFLKEKTGSEDISLDVDICMDLGVDGDDMFELIEEYFAQFKVDVKNYIWYFHHGDEASIGCNPLMIFIKDPFRNIPHILLTPRMLIEFANQGSWNLDYPEHEVPGRSAEIRGDKALIGILSLLAFLLFLAKC